MPSSVMIALVAGFCLNSSAAYFNTAVNGAFSGTLSTLKGNLGSDVSVILKVTLEADAEAILKYSFWNTSLQNSWECVESGTLEDATH